jgi:hypothetical protein
LLLGSLLFSLTIGCSHHIQIQKSHVVEDQLLPRLDMATPVSIVSKPHPSTAKVQFCKPAVGACTVLYADVTQYAAQSMIDIFARNNVAVSAEASKSLVFTIAEASCDQEMNGIKFNVTLNVSAGQGSPKAYTGYQRSWSAHGNDFSVSAATLNAVLEMFKDEEVRRYLEGG